MPNLFQLLSPVSERASQFHVGSFEYDPQFVGFQTTAFPGSFLLDTRIKGNGNGGHEFRDGCRKDGVIGRALSPDERYLYVGNWDPAKKVVMRYEVGPDGSLAAGRVFFDMTAAPGEDAIDGIKVDQRGNLYVSGPWGLWILSPEGKHLGTLRGPEHPHNLAWGDDDGKTLYITALSGIYKIRTLLAGVRPGPQTGS